MMESSNFKRILVAVDDSPCSEKALRHAKNIARDGNVSVGIITVVQPSSAANYGADPLLGQQPIIVPEVSEIQQQAAEKFLNKIAQEFDGAKEVYTFNRIGTIRDEILRTAEEWSADLIVLGTSGRTGLDHFLSGSVAESVIRKSNCPVLVIPVNCED